MDNGLVPTSSWIAIKELYRLNPCCSGQWSRTARQIADATNQTSLNPCCSGQWSRTAGHHALYSPIGWVLILVVVDNGLVLMLMVQLLSNLALS